MLEHEFFPEQWIKPGEYSFCGACGKNETLMKCISAERPKCLFCHGVNIGQLIPNPYLELYHYLSLRKFSWRTLKRCLKWTFNFRYRSEIKEKNLQVQKLRKEKRDQEQNAKNLHKERNELARHRKEDLKLPAVFWMKSHVG